MSAHHPRSGPPGGLRTPLPPAPAMTPEELERWASARLSRRIGNLLAFAVILPVTLIVTSPLWWLAAHALRWAI